MRTRAFGLMPSIATHLLRSPFAPSLGSRSMCRCARKHIHSWLVVGFSWTTVWDYSARHATLTRPYLDAHC